MGSLNHSVFRWKIAAHITFSPKRREKRLLGHAVEVQAVLRSLIIAEGLEAIAVAAEAGDHVHLLVRHPGPGGTPPTFSYPKFINKLKTQSTKAFKAFDPEFCWQTGYALAAVHGGPNGAEQALAIVRRYIEAQGAQEDAVADNHEAED